MSRRFNSVDSTEMDESAAHPPDLRINSRRLSASKSDLGDWLMRGFLDVCNTLYPSRLGYSSLALSGVPNTPKIANLASSEVLVFSLATSALLIVAFDSSRKLPWHINTSR